MTDLQMIRNTNKWPYLPVKRGDVSLENKNLGLLVDDGKSLTVYLYRLPKTLKDSPKTEYTSHEALLADGWVID